MSDAVLRALERRWRESGELEDEVRWLQERMRLGLLGEGEVELASALGHSASRACAPRPRCPFRDKALLKVQPKRVSVALALHVAELSFEVWDVLTDKPTGAVRLARAWLREPDRTEARTGREVGVADQAQCRSGGYSARVTEIGSALAELGRAVWAPGGASAGRYAHGVLFHAAQALSPPGAEQERAWNALEPRVRAALGPKLLPWLVGALSTEELLA
ncbi:MAG: hypothetical protein R3F62_24295 [Planctomycetota bacterium]